MSNFKVGDFVMWPASSRWESFSNWKKDKIVSETKTEFKTETGERILKSNNFLRGCDYKRVELFDVIKWNEDKLAIKEYNMRCFISKNFEKYFNTLKVGEVNELYLKVKAEIEKTTEVKKGE